MSVDQTTISILAHFTYQSGAKPYSAREVIDFQKNTKLYLENIQKTEYREGLDFLLTYGISFRAVLGALLVDRDGVWVPMGAKDNAILFYADLSLEHATEHKLRFL